MNEHVAHGEKRGEDVNWSRIWLVIGVCIAVMGVVKFLRMHHDTPHPAAPAVRSAPAAVAVAQTTVAAAPVPLETTVVDVPASDSPKYSAILDVPKGHQLCREAVNVEMKYRPVGSSDSDPDHFITMDQMDRVYANAYVFKAKSDTGFTLKTCQVAFGDTCPQTCPDPK